MTIFTFLNPGRATFKALGNAVHVGVVYEIAIRLLQTKELNEESVRNSANAIIEKRGLDGCF